MVRMLPPARPFLASTARSLAPLLPGFAAAAAALVLVPGEAHAGLVDLGCGPSSAVQMDLQLDVGAGLWKLLGPHHGSGARIHCAGARVFGLAFLGLATLAIIALARLRHATDQRRLELARKLVEQGMEPPRELLTGQPSRDLRKGIVLLFAGVGLVVAAVFKGDQGLAPVGLIPGFIGVGYLVSFALAVRRRSP